MRLSKIAAGLALVLILGVGFAPQARADDKSDLQQKLKNLTPEQKAKLKERIREKLKNLTPEQKEKLKELLKDRRQGR
jgi:hypothetical protein